MIYLNKKEDVEQLAEAMEEQNFVCSFMHGGLS